MPLITCQDCNKPVSDKADKCIHCGCPLKTGAEIKANDIKKENPTREERIYYGKPEILEPEEQSDEPDWTGGDCTSYRIFISNKTVKFGNRTFNPNLITSVSVTKIINPKKAYEQTSAIIGVIISVPICFGIMMLILLGINNLIGDLHGDFKAVLGFIIFFGLEAFYLINVANSSKRVSQLKPRGRIDFDTSSGRVKDVITMDYQLACEIERAISAMMKDKN